MFHAFIIKLSAHIKLCYCHRKQSNYMAFFPAHLKLCGQISVLDPCRAQPTCRHAALKSSWISTMTVSRRHWNISSSSSSSSFFPLSEASSGNEVGLWDDALHFVISRVGWCLVVTDCHFMSVSLKSKQRERHVDLQPRNIHRYTSRVSG